MTDGQFYGAILWHHFMAPFYGACVLGLKVAKLQKPGFRALETLDLRL